MPSIPQHTLRHLYATGQLLPASTGDGVRGAGPGITGDAHRVDGFQHATTWATAAFTDRQPGYLGMAAKQLVIGLWEGLTEIGAAMKGALGLLDVFRLNTVAVPAESPVLTHLPTASAARITLSTFGITQVPLTDENAEAASAALTRQYGADSADSPEALREYLQNPAYFFSSLQQHGSDETGILSGFFFQDSRGLQLDYLSQLEKESITTRDVEASKALLALQIEKYKPNFVFVEADETMGARYQQLGFVKMATAAPDSEGGARWDMYALPVTPQAKATAKEPKELKALWLTHVNQWYRENYDGLDDGANAAKKASALKTITDAAAQGRLVWVQEMPKTDP